MASGKLSYSDFSDPISSEDLREPAGAKAFLGNTLLDQYTLVDHIGCGAMGLVFKAFHKHLDKHVAVKLIRADMNNNPKSLVRFQQEAIALGRLNHPNIITTMDFGIITGGVPFLVMELIAGKNLAELLKAGQFTDLNKVTSLFLQIIRGLSYAHSKGVIHRDIKPSNIIIENWDQEDFTAKIVDFGLAKLEEKDISLTLPGTGLGTALYMSPEQCEGDQVDERSDLYSLGCLMFEIVSGNPPFKGESSMETISLHRNAPLPPLSSRNFEVPDFIHEAILKCLAKNPKDRFDSAQKLLDYIESYLTLTEELNESNESNESELLAPEGEDAQDGQYRDKGFNYFLIVVFLLMTGTMAFFVINKVRNSSDVPRQISASKTSKVILGETLAAMPDERSINENLSKNVFDDLKFYKEKGWWKPGLGNPGLIDTRELKNLLDARAISVRKLNLNFCRGVDDSSVVIINQFPLHSLKITKTSITSSGLKKLRALTKLQYLEVSGMDLSNKMEALTNFPSLKALVIRQCKLTNNDLKTISSIKSLRSLDISRPLNMLGKEGIRSLQNLPHLRVLTIMHTSKLPPEAIEEIAKLRHLEILNLKDVDTIEMEEVKLLSKMKLQRIGLSLSPRDFKIMLECPSYKRMDVQVITPELSEKELDFLSKNWPRLTILK